MTPLEWLDRGGPAWLEWIDPRNVIPRIRIARHRWRVRRAERCRP